jgi:hypothetical protein
MPDAAYDDFVTALVAEKNTFHKEVRYALITREDPEGLSKIKAGDKLYIGIHGSRSGRVYTTAPDGKTPNFVMTGSGLAEFLIAAGLPRVEFKLYLWTCQSAAVPEDSPNGLWKSLGGSVMTQVASRLKEAGYRKVVVTGYTQDVSLVKIGMGPASKGILQDPHKKVWLPKSDTFPHGMQVPTKGFRQAVITSGFSRAH